MRKITIDDLGEMLRQPWLATLATYRKDGTVLLSPVWFEWDGEAFIVSVVGGDGKERHIRTDPRVSLCIAEEETFPGRLIEASGRATLKPDAGAAGIRRIATRYLGPELTDRWIEQYGSFDWQLMRLVPEKVRAIDHRDEGFLRDARAEYLNKDYTQVGS